MVKRKRLKKDSGKRITPRKFQLSPQNGAIPRQNQRNALESPEMKNGKKNLLKAPFPINNNNAKIDFAVQI